MNGLIETNKMNKQNETALSETAKEYMTETVNRFNKDDATFCNFSESKAFFEFTICYKNIT